MRTLIFIFLCLSIMYLVDYTIPNYLTANVLKMERKNIEAQLLKEKQNESNN